MFTSKCIKVMTFKRIIYVVVHFYDNFTPFCFAEAVYLLMYIREKNSKYHSLTICIQFPKNNKQSIPVQSKHTVVFYDKVRKRYWTGFNGHRKRKASHFPLWQPVHLWVKYCMCGMGCLPTWSNLFFRLEFVLDAYPDQELHALTCNHWTIAVIKVSHVL